MNLNQITVPVSNLEKAVLFYQKLGLKLIVKSPPEYARFVCPDGNSTFSLHRVDEPPHGDGIWVYFEVENVDEIYLNLNSLGVLFEDTPEDKPWLWREVRLKDPDNNQIIIYHAGTNRLDPPWKLQ